MTDLDKLKIFGVFEGLTDHELEEVSRCVVSVSIKKGAYLFYRNDITSGMFFVISGRFQIIIDNESNKEITVYTVAKGDFIGEMSLYSDGIRSATAVALKDATLYKISNKDFIALLRSNAIIGVNLSKALVSRLLAANEMIERLGAMDGSERVADYLKALAAREGTLSKDSFNLERPTYQQMSLRLGLSEKTIYRSMRDLALVGLITMKGRKLIIRKELVEDYK